MDDILREQVRRRALSRCEYCRVPQSAYDFTFPIDHVIARQHGGDSRLENLALCCSHCNRFKGPNIAGIDNMTGSVTRLFHPRRDHWHHHFQWDGPIIVGLTDVGRVTVSVLAFNTASRIAARTILIDEGKILR